MKMIKILLIGVTAVLLTACGKNNGIEDGIAQAGRIGDPYESAMVLSKAMLDSQNPSVFENSSFPISDSFTRNPVGQLKDAQSLLGDYLVKAVERGDKRVMPIIVKNDIPREVLKRSAPYIIAQANLPDASAEVLLAASNLTLLGRHAQKDFKQSFEFLSRSWALEQNPMAAVYARAIFVGLADGPNAYLWSLRCLDLSPWPDAWFEKDRLPSERIEIQSRAHDPKVLMVAPSPLKPFKG